MRIPFWRRKQDRELDDEIESHLRMASRDRVERGESPEQARESARREMGNVGLVKEVTRDTWGGRWLRNFGQDLRYGMRMLRGNPGFTAIAVVTLALGIGANTAIFSLVNAVLLRNLPVQQPKELFQLAGVGPAGDSWGFSYPSFERIRNMNHSFSGVAAVGTRSSGLPATVNGKTEPADSELVSGNFFTLLGVHAAAGRTFTADEDRAPGASPVAVMSYDYWNRRFHRDASIIGKTMTLRGTTFTILGVAPRDFFGVSVGTSPDVYVPMMMERAFHPKPFVSDDSVVWTQVFGRLRPGVNQAQALADFGVLFSDVQSRLVATLSVASGHEKENILGQKAVLLSAANGLNFDVRKRFTDPLLILMGIVGLVLVIACANVANLLLARGTARRKEIAVRLALGAGTGRLVRQLLTESLLLGFAGGALGLLIALWTLDGIVALMSVGRASLIFNLQPDLRLIAFTAAVSMFVTILFGLAPARSATRIDVAPTLKESAGTTGPGGSRGGPGKVLIVAQVAISLILLFGTGLLVRTLINLRTLDPGFDRNNVLLFDVNPAPAGYKGAATTVLYGQVLEKLEAIPGVRAASFSFLAPVTGGGAWTNPVDVVGYVQSASEDVTVYVNSVGPHYFETLHTPLLKGRTLGPEDTSKTPLVAVINQAMARYFFGEADPVGKKFGWYGDTSKNRAMYTVVGVVADAKYETLREQTPRTVFLDALQDDNDAAGFEVRMSGDPASFAPEIRRTIQTLNSGIRVGGFETLTSHIESTLGNEHLMVTLCGLLAGLAGLLACLGLYGVTSYGVARRRKEIGIRMALGAQQSNVLWMVQRGTLRLVFVGIAIGLPVGIVASSFISSTLFNVTGFDPITIAVVVLLLTFVTLLAGYLPARKASRVDPIEALRNE
jgi:predicted permease